MDEDREDVRVAKLSVIEGVADVVAAVVAEAGSGEL
jgi:hypothetical protein